MNKTSLEIHKQEGLALRGLAIILIVLHNVSHFLCPITENEFIFNINNVNSFVNHWLDAPFTSIFSFYGWVGVSVFVFLSGYGLMAKYENSEINIKIWLKNHYLKLVLLISPALLILFFGGSYSNDISWDQIKTFCAEQLLLLNIIAPDRIWPGIYWYVGMALQLYILFLLIRKLNNKNLIIIAIFTCVFLAFVPSNVLNYLRHNFVGWLPEFILGIIYFRFFKNREFNIQKRLKFAAIIILLILFIAVSFNRTTFFLQGVVFILFLLTIKTYLSKSSIIVWIGTISGAIYVVHAVIRNYWLDSFFLYFSPLANAFIVLIISILISIPYSYYYNFIKGYLQRSDLKKSPS